MGPFDAVIVLDGSGSVKRNNWQKEVDFAQTLVHQFEVSPYKSHIGLIAFSEGAQTYLDLNDNGMSQSSVNTQLNQIRSYWNDPHARTFTDAALKKAADMFIRYKKNIIRIIYIYNIYNILNLWDSWCFSCLVILIYR